MGRIRRTHRKLINKYNQLRLRNRDFSLVANNCNGGLILHELGLRFNSPFVNVWMYPEEYIKLLGNLEYYMGCELCLERVEGDLAFCRLDDVTVILAHFTDLQEAMNKWRERVKRINYENLFFLFSDRDGCTMEHLMAFDALPYKNKVVFTHRPYPQIKSAVYIKGFENDGYVGELYKYKYKRLGWKYFDDFDYVSWFNRGR